MTTDEKAGRLDRQFSTRHGFPAAVIAAREALDEPVRRKLREIGSYLRSVGYDVGEVEKGGSADWRVGVMSGCGHGVFVGVRVGFAGDLMRAALYVRRPVGTGPEPTMVYETPPDDASTQPEAIRYGVLYVHNTAVLDAVAAQVAHGIDPAHDAVRPYEAMLAVAHDVGWPAGYKTDLTAHDRSTLLNKMPKRFVWLVRELGTQIAVPRDDGQSAMNDLRACLRQWPPGERSKLYAWDGKRLVPVTADAAATLIHRWEREIAPPAR